MTFVNVFIIMLIFICGIVGVCVFIYKKINYYPHKEINIDITNKTKMDNNDLLDYYIINYGYEKLLQHIQSINNWKNEKILRLEDNKEKIYKFNLRCKKNEYKAFHFTGIRVKTRYKQVNYQRYPYKVNTISNSFSLSDTDVLQRVKFLKEHDYNVTFNNYNRVDQRKALTKQLREQIKIRDNYTCQICGKYMPDEVGLHIDHIISIKNGGKSTPSNLRVLCSKCNGRKGGNNN